jgi:outer membrane immunogenic protein
MKRVLIGGAIAASLFAAPGASAADLPARVYTKAPVMVDPVYSWTGFYVGINGGYSWGRASETAPIGAPFPGSFTARQDVNGGFGGGQIGYNWQVDPRWLLGLEADIQGSGERGRSNDNLGSIRIGRFGLTASTANSVDFPWFATFRGRAGLLADPSLLLYVTGGLAVGEVKFTTQPTATVQVFDGDAPIGAPIAAVSPALSDSQTRVGWTAGAGLEKKFTPNWSAKLEYLYMDFGSKTYFSGASAIPVSFHDHVFRAGINYEFAAGPVVARY